MESKGSAVSQSGYNSKKGISDRDTELDGISGLHIAEAKDTCRAAGSSLVRLSSKEINSVSNRIASMRDEKKATISDDEDDADAEFEALLRKPNIGAAFMSSDPIARRIADGLRINHMSMYDEKLGTKIWETKKFGSIAFKKEMLEEIPKSILNCRSITREVNFYSKEELENFRIEQRVYYGGQCIEEWFFKFGYVIPGSTNTWQQTIQAAAPSEMLPAEALSGNVQFETSFYDDKLLLCKNVVRIFYV